jgi:uncharacterized protein involved in exopolysaccharide biosynthesis
MKNMTDIWNNLEWMFEPRFWKTLIIGCIVTFILIFFITSPLIIKPIYRAETVIFVPLTLFSQQYEQLGIGFGSNAEIDGHIQILKSTKILDSLGYQFGLYERWNINPIGDDDASRFYQIINKQITIEKTRYGSVAIKVKDHDPKLATDMANAIVKLGDIIKQEILLENRLITINFARDQFENSLSEVKNMENQLINTQIETRGTYDSNALEMIRKRVSYETELSELNTRKNRYETLKKSLEVPIPGAYLVSPAVMPYRPIWPPRLLFSFIGLVIFAVVLIFVQIVKRDAQDANTE